MMNLFMDPDKKRKRQRAKRLSSCGPGQKIDCGPKKRKSSFAGHKLKLKSVPTTPEGVPGGKGESRRHENVRGLSGGFDPSGPAQIPSPEMRKKPKMKFMSKIFKKKKKSAY